MKFTKSPEANGCFAVNYVSTGGEEQFLCMCDKVEMADLLIKILSAYSTAAEKLIPSHTSFIRE